MPPGKRKFSDGKRHLVRTKDIFIRFLIQVMGFPPFAILAGVFEMIARALAGIIFVPLFGYTGAYLGGPAAWILADAFLIPAYFHVKHKLEERDKFIMREE